MATTSTRQLGFNIAPPTKDGFGGAPWKGDANLAILADRVMSKHAERFKVARQYSIEYLWRANGGTSRGEPKFADCVKLGGLAYHFSTADFVIWFAADHLADFGFKDAEYEALMFRQLMHIGSNENTGSATLVGFDFKGFNAELAAYGPWDEALKKMHQTLQPALFDDAAEHQDAEAASPAEVQPTEDLSAQFMASEGWPVDPPPTNGHDTSESDRAAEEAFAASRKR